jgi:hypothetical protein
MWYVMIVIINQGREEKNYENRVLYGIRAKC